MIGSLLYVTTSWFDVMQGVGQVARFKETPNEFHIVVVKRILWYIKGTTEYGLWYPKATDLVIQAYTDADWAGSVDDRKSTSGATFYLGGCLISWLSKNQSSILLSTTEAEYIVAVPCCTQVLWMKQTLQDLQVKFDEPIPIFCDNTSAINISKNHVMHSKTKHIPIKYDFVKRWSLKRISSLNMLAQRNKFLTYLPNHYLVKNLSIFAKSLGFSQVLIRIFLLSN